MAEAPSLLPSGPSSGSSSMLSSGFASGLSSGVASGSTSDLAAAELAAGGSAGAEGASLQRLLSERPILIVVGSGGVGKTTTAATLALLAALQGRKVLVLTIDPARRLADALGLQALGHDIQ